MVRPEWRRLRPGPRAGRRWPARDVRERGGSRPRRARRPGPLPRRSREPSRSPPRRPRRRRPGERAERAASSGSLADGDERPQTLAPDTPQAAHAAEIVHRRKTAPTVMSGRRRSRLTRPRPRTRRRSSTDAKRPPSSRAATMRCASPGPTPGRRARSSTPASLRSSGPGDGASTGGAVSLAGRPRRSVDDGARGRSRIGAADSRPEAADGEAMAPPGWPSATAGVRSSCSRRSTSSGWCARQWPTARPAPAAVRTARRRTSCGRV